MTVAHDGPPYPILVDEVAGGFVLSVWADPDVGEGTFFYYVEAPPGRSASEVSIDVASSSASEPATTVRGVSSPAPGDAPYQHLGTLPFTHRGTWNTTFVLRATDAERTALGELSVDLDVTPPGLGAVELLWFAIPFVTVGALWLRIFLAQRAHDRKSSLAPVHAVAGE